MMARSTTLQSKAGYIDARPFTTSSTNPLATHGRTIHRVVLAVRRPLPVYLDEQTISEPVRTSHSGHGPILPVVHQHIVRFSADHGQDPNRFPLIGRPAIQPRRRPLLVLDDGIGDDHAR